MKTVLKGFGFGLLLQLAIGPLCVYITKTALVSGLLPAFSGVVAVTLVDALFVALALLGIGGLIKTSHAKAALKLAGGAVIILFGLAILLSSFEINLLSAFSAGQAESGASVFITAVVLTLSSPLTIVFWVGVFGTRLAEDGTNLGSTVLFGTGAVLSTLVSLTAVAVVAGCLSSLMTPVAIRVLNLVAGFALIVFGVHMLTKKN